jgi:hypothetical protein
MKNILLSIGILFSSLTGLAQETISGYVYEDLNQNFKKDKQ